MGDLIPPRSLVENRCYAKRSANVWLDHFACASNLLVSHNNGHSCCWCQVEGNELTLLTLSALSPARETLDFASGGVCSRASDKLMAAFGSGVIV